MSYAATRQRYKREATDNGLSMKTYMARRYPSVGWAYMAEVIRKRCRSKGLPFDLTPSYLRGVFSEQQGVCPLTGWLLEPKKSGSGTCLRTMTVDRIDQSKGYEKGNIRLVAFAVNSFRGVNSDQELLDLCKAVVKTLGDN